MNPSLSAAIRTLHLVAMAIWVGGPVVAAFGARNSLMAGGEAALDRVRWLTLVTPVFILSALVTIGTGIGLIIGLGGLSAVRGSVQVGALLAICVIPIGGAMNRPALLKLTAHFQAGGAPAAAAPLVSRFLLAHRIEQTLRFAALILMVVPI